MKAPCHKYGIFPLILLAFIFAGRLGYGQTTNEGNNWYFGNYAALDFNSSPPTNPTNSSMLQGGYASSSISDINGNLLFYTNGNTIWNSSHAIMANGILGYNVVGASIIVKQPGNPNLYYIFYSNASSLPYLFRYSVVDLSLAAGMGSVTVKNVPISNFYCTQFGVVNHCNGIDSWIVAAPSPLTNSVVNTFHSYLLSSTGLNTLSIQSSIPSHTFATGFNGYLRLKISPNGRNIIVTEVDRYLYDFNNSTGIVSNPRMVPVIWPNGNVAYQFSPDGSKLFICSGNLQSGPMANAVMQQLDLCAGTHSAVLASSYFFAISSPGHLELSSDGKIHCAKYPNPGQPTHSYSLGVINNPNVMGVGCNYSDFGQSLGTHTALSLPNFPSNYFYQKPSPAPFTVSIGAGGGNCLSRNFNTPQSPSMGCSATGYTLTNVAWNFGDPGSGANNTSFLNNPTHVFSGPGTYTTQLIMYYTCGGGTDTLRQTVTIQSPTTSVSSTSITCASLGSATVIAGGGTGPYTYTWLPVNQSASVATGLSPGSYTIQVFDAGLNCVATNSLSFSSLIPLTASVSSSPSITCNGASTGTASVFNIAGGSASQNFLWTNGLLSYTSNPVSVLSAGSWSSTVTDALTGCQVFSVFSISQPPALTLNLSSGSPSICAGGSVVLSSTLSGGTPAYAYSWTGGANTDSFVLSTNSPASYVYTLNALDAYSCAVSNTLGVDVITNPILSVPNVFICPLETGTLSVSGASSYTWSNNSVGNTFTDSPLSNSTYTVVGEALGCTNTAVASINLKALPNPVLSSNSPVCESSNFSLSATAGTTYVWSGPGGFSSFVSVVSIPSVSLTQSGVYNLTVTAANACTASVSHTVVVKPLPTLTLSASAASICLGVNAATLSASGSGTLNQWYVPGSITSFSNNALVQVSPTVSSTYSVNSYLNGCLRSQSVSLSVISPPNLSIALSSNSFCAQAFNGSPNTITLTSSGASSYTLSTPNHFSNANPSGPASPINLMPPYTNSGVATATLFGSNGVCTVSTTAQFSVVPNPTASVSNPTPVICAGQSYTYTSSGASSYVWSSSTPGSSLYTAGNVAVVNPSIQSVFSVYGSSVGCQSALQSYTLSVNPLPTVAVVPNPTYVCIGSPTELRAKSNGTSFVWYPQNITGSTILVAPSVKQQYTVVASLNNCTQSAVALVSVMPLPIARIVNNTPQLCVNEKVQMLASGGQAYVWKGPEGLIQQGSELSFFAFSKAFEGIYTVTVTDELGCKGTSQDTLRLLDLPTGNLLAGKEKGCAPFTTGFVFDTGTKPNERVAGVDWYVNQRHVSSATSYSQAFVLAGNYSVQVHVKGVNGCVNTSSLLVTAYPKPKADFSYSPLLPVENLDEVVFENSSVGAQEFSWYIRLDNDKKLEYNGERVNYLFENPGLYPVVLLAKSEMGCSDTLIKTIKVEPDFAVYIPKAFTPNGDGKNEGFMPVMRGVRNFTLQIFNRWGQLLFESNTLNNTWDGSYRGVECKQDVYNYKLLVLSSSGEEKVYAGNVMLYR
jgi:gliding motility-associated-like protein